MVCKEITNGIVTEIFSRGGGNYDPLGLARTEYIAKMCIIPMIWICADILINYIFIFMVKISMDLFKYVIHASIKDDSITPIGGV